MRVPVVTEFLKVFEAIFTIQSKRKLAFQAFEDREQQVQDISSMNNTMNLYKSGSARVNPLAASKRK